MKTILTHFVQMDTYEVPDKIASQDDEEIEGYIIENELKPIKSDSRDWEIVEIN